MKTSPTQAELDVLLAMYFHRRRIGDQPVTMAELRPNLPYPGKVLSGVRLSLHAKGLAEAIAGKHMRITPAGYAAAVGRGCELAKSHLAIEAEVGESPRVGITATAAPTAWGD